MSKNTRTYELALKRDEVLAKIKSSYNAGLKYFQENNLALAEQEFVKVMRPVLSKPLMKDPYVSIDDCKAELLDAIYHLGQIYLVSEKYSEHHAKAAGIFQYCARFAKEHQIKLHHDNGEEKNFLRDAYLVEEQFIAALRASSKSRCPSESNATTMEDYYLKHQQEFDGENGYKQRLERIRSEVEQKLAQINTLTLGRIVDRTKVVEDLYKDCTAFFVNNNSDKDSNPGFIQKLLQSCFSKIGAPPEGCDYSIIGLGSLAGGKMTPWSDLEFAVLVNDDRVEYKEYFRNLIKLMHIKVINLGETPLRIIGVEALNNFRTANVEDDWFWDDLTSNGFSFDGADWYACKSPLGRQGKYKAAIKNIGSESGIEETRIVDKSDYELILTPLQMAAFQKEQPIQIVQEEILRVQSVNSGASYMNDISANVKTSTNEVLSEDSWFKSDMHLVQSLRIVVLIDGSQTLLDNYKHELRSAEDPEIIRNRALEKLKEDLASFSLKLGEKEEGKLLDVKKDIFRIGDRIIENLANYYEIGLADSQPGLTAWEIIDKMASVGEKGGEVILSREGAQHLKEALSIATALRLATYSHNKGQSETMSTYEPAVNHLTEEERKHLLQETFYVQDTSILHHFYYVMLKVQHLMYEFCSQHHNVIDVKIWSTDFLFDDSNYLKGMVHARFLEYDRAIQFMEDARAEKPQDISLLSDLYLLYNKTGAVEKAVRSAENILRLLNDKSKDYPNHPDIAASYNNLGNAYHSKGDYEKAIESYSKALAFFKIAHGDNSNYPSIATSYSNIGNTYCAEGNFEDGIKWNLQALEIRVKAYVNNPNHPDIADSYNNLGSAYHKKGEYEEAIDNYSKGLAIYKIAYNHSPNHPAIAASYNNLGLSYHEKGEYEEAISNYSKALAIYKISNKHNPNHPAIATSYSNLGNTYCAQKDYKKGIDQYKKALDVRGIVYKHNPNHPAIAASYNNLGNAYQEMGENDLAIDWHKKALDVRIIAYKYSLIHPDIAASYNNLGNVYHSKGENDLAIDYHKKALDMRVVAYKHNPNHPDLATSYNNLGNAYYAKGENDLAIDYHKKALDIRVIAYEYNPNHPEIAASYNNLGAEYVKKGEYEKAIEYFNKSLASRKIIYGEGVNNLSIADSYNNLGEAYRAKGECEEAIEYHNKALDIKVNVCDISSNHPYIAVSYSNLSLAYQDLGIKYLEKKGYKEGIKYFEKSLENCLKAHEKSVGCYNNLGVVHGVLGVESYAEGDYEEAIKHFNNSLENYLNAYGDNLAHASIVVSYNNLGVAYRDLGTVYCVNREYNKALDSFKKAIFIQRKVFPEDHPNVINTLSKLNFLEEELTKQSETKTDEVVSVIDPSEIMGSDSTTSEQDAGHDLIGES